MQQLLLAVAASLCLFHTAVALQCKDCVQFSFHTDIDNDMVQSILEGFNNAGNVDCKNKPTYVNSKTCPSASSGMKMVCSSNSITMKFEMKAIDYSMDVDMTIRGCDEVERDTDTSVTSCKPYDMEWLKEHREEMKEKMQASQGGGGMSMAMRMLKEISGKKCICGESDCT